MPAEKKGKRPKSKSKHKKMQIWKKYRNGKAEGRWCPRCGPGTFLAAHKNRVMCGKCGYAEIKKA